jgi:hypothetical protein
MLASRYPQDYGDRSTLELETEPLTVIRRVIIDPSKVGTWKDDKGTEELRRRDRRAIDVDPIS